MAPAAGISLEDGAAGTYVEPIAEQTRERVSSMLADVPRRQPREIDTLNGALLRTAERHRIDAPTRSCLNQRMRLVQVTYEMRLG